MHLDKQHPRPVYLQLKEILQCQIEQGIFFLIKSYRLNVNYAGTIA
jgi:hypothetical protein